MRDQLIRLLAVIAFAFASPAWAQDADTARDAQEPDVTTLEEVVVVGRDISETAEAFVSAVSAPAVGREPAIWRHAICVGVGGMSPDPARALADRVSDWGHSLGLDISSPGCRPNIVIVATDDGNAAARQLVAASPRNFRTGASGANRGAAALRDFQESGKSVRWWHVSLPVHEDTGDPAVRLPREGPFSAPSNMTRPADFGTVANTSSRLSDHIQDDLQKVVIVLDSRALEKADFGQIVDYIAMVALAQISPDARPETPSILNLFEVGETQETSLSRWDQAYLRALYTTRLGAPNARANLSALADATARRASDAH